METFTDAERARLGPFFTNLERPVFGLRLPQEVAGALFSRYSRTAKSLRRVFLDEFAGAEGLGSAPPSDDASLARAREFYERVLVGYGDDSVAQLGGAHVAVERVSNVGAKLLQDSRVGVAYLEKSTRYVRFDQRGEDGDWLFHKEPRLLASRHAEAYLGLMNTLFSAYARQLDPMIALVNASLPPDGVPLTHPRTGRPMTLEEADGSPELKRAAERARAAAVRAHACDVMRGYLPAATLTNLGIFASGQAFEHLLDKLYSQELAEGHELARSIHGELSTLIPSFVKRAGRSPYLSGLAGTSRAAAAALEAAGSAFRAAAAPVSVQLVDFDAGAEERVLAGLVYRESGRPLSELREHAARLPEDERRRLFESFAALRRHRRDKPTRALESVSYTFDIVANLGIYRDLQRHRILSQERQLFTAGLGFDTPPEIEESGFRADWADAMGRAHEVWQAIAREFPLEAQYAVPFAYRVRWTVTLNLREAVFLCELRSMPQGHPDYRRVVQEMWRLVEGVHPGLAAFGRFVNMETYRLGRLQSELRTEYKRSLVGEA